MNFLGGQRAHGNLNFDDGDDDLGGL